MSLSIEIVMLVEHDVLIERHIAVAGNRRYHPRSSKRLLDFSNPFFDGCFYTGILPASARFPEDGHAPGINGIGRLFSPVTPHAGIEIVARFRKNRKPFIDHPSDMFVTTQLLYPK